MRMIAPCPAAASIRRDDHLDPVGVACAVIAALMLLGQPIPAAPSDAAPPERN